MQKWNPDKLVSKVIEYRLGISDTIHSSGRHFASRKPEFEPSARSNKAAGREAVHSPALV
jgi:hypothetical protein